MMIVCTAPGCHQLLELKAGNTRCPAHKRQPRIHVPRPSEQRGEADKHRGSSRERGYDTSWNKYAKGFLLDHPFCAMCHRPRAPKLAQLVDHIIPADVAPDLFRDPDNHQALCRSCHAKKSAMDRHRYGKPRRSS